MRTLPRIALTLFVVAGSLAASAAVVLRPTAVERRVEDLLASTLRAPTHFRDARFSPGGGLVVRELVVLDPHDPLAPPLVRVESARIDLQFGRPGKLVHVNGIQLTGLHVRVRRLADGTFRLAGLIHETDADGGPVPPIVVDGGTLAYSDAEWFRDGVALELELERMTYLPTALDGDLPPAERRKFTLSAHSETTGNVHVTVSRLSAGRVDLAASLDGVDLSSELAHGIAGDLGDRIREFGPNGKLAVADLRLTLREGADPAVSGTFRPRDVGVAWTAPGAREPLRVAGLSGALRLDGGAITVADADGERIEAQLHEETRAPARLAAWGEVTGVFGAGDTRVDVHARARALRLRPGLHPRLPADVVAFLEEFAITASVDADVTVSGDPEAPDVNAKAALSEATFNYVGVPAGPNGELDGFPFKVNVSKGSVSYADRELTYEATATRGKARVVSTGTVRWNDELDNESIIDVTGYDVPLDDDLRSAFGSSAREYWDPFTPSGEVEEVRVRVRRLFDVRPLESVAEYDIVLDGRAGFEVREFPAPIGKVTGEVQLRRPRTDAGRAVETTLKDVRAVGEGFTLAIDSVLRDDGDETKERFHAVAEVGDLAGAFQRGLLASTEVDDATKEQVRAIDARGAARVELDDDADGVRVVIELKGAETPGWEDMPIALADLQGVVRISGSRTELDQVRARALGTSVRADGHLEDVGGEIRPALEVAAPELHLGPSLRDGLGSFVDDFADLWTDLAPGDDAFADAFLTLRPDDDHRLELRDLRGGFAPLDLPIVLEQARVVYEGDEVKLTASASLEHARGTVREFVADTESGVFTFVVDFNGLHFPEDLAGVLPDEEIAEIVETARHRTLHGRGLRITARPEGRELELAGELDVRPRSRTPSLSSAFEIEGILELMPLRLVQDADGEGADVSGRVRFREVDLEAGIDVEDLSAEADVTGRFATDERTTRFELTDASFQAFDRRVTNASMRLQFDEDALRIRRFDGTLAGGRVSGRFTAGARGPGSFNGLVRLKGARGEHFFHATEDERVEGALNGEVRFDNLDGEDESLSGTGSFSLRDGRFLNVPVFAGLLQTWKEIVPGVDTEGSNHFEKVKLQFDLDGQWLEIRQLEMLSQALEVTQGRGRIGLDGRLDFAVRPHLQAGVFGIDDFIRFVQQIGLQGIFGLEFRVTGTLRNPRVRSRWLSYLTGDEERGASREPAPTDRLHPRKRDPW